jgi:hypothetical protein
MAAFFSSRGGLKALEFLNCTLASPAAYGQLGAGLARQATYGRIAAQAQLPPIGITPRGGGMSGCQADKADLLLPSHGQPRAARPALW